jgi:hypothetical protein
MGWEKEKQKQDFLKSKRMLLRLGTGGSSL